MTKCLERSFSKYQRQVLLTSKPYRRHCAIRGTFPIKKDPLTHGIMNTNFCQKTFLIFGRTYTRCRKASLDIYWLIYDLFIETLSTLVFITDLWAPNNSVTLGQTVAAAVGSLRLLTWRRRRPSSPSIWFICPARQLLPPTRFTNTERHKRIRVSYVSRRLLCKTDTCVPTTTDNDYV